MIGKILSWLLYKILFVFALLVSLVRGKLMYFLDDIYNDLKENND